MPNLVLFRKGRKDIVRTAWRHADLGGNVRGLARKRARVTKLSVSYPPRARKLAESLP